MANKTKIGPGKLIVEFDAESGFTSLFRRRFGEERLVQRLFNVLRGKLPTTTELIKGANVVAFIKDEDAGALRAYGRFLERMAPKLPAIDVNDPAEGDKPRTQQ